jgi:hypothetical protein
MKKLLVLTVVLMMPLLFVVGMQFPMLGVLLLGVVGNNLNAFIVVALSVLMILAVTGFGSLFLSEAFGILFILGALF